jgi:hypothetical protein
VTLAVQIGHKVAGALSGIVTFYDGGKLLGSDPPDSTGQAQFISNILAAGMHSITATYSGDPDFAEVTSAAKTIKISP